MVYNFDKVVITIKKRNGNFLDLVKEKEYTSLDIFNPDIEEYPDFNSNSIKTKNFYLYPYYDNKSKSDVYKDVFMVMYKNEEFGLIYLNRYRNIYQVNKDNSLVGLELNNLSLWKYGKDIFDVYKLLLDELDCYENNISSLHICLDCNENLYNKFLRLYKKVINGKYVFVSNVKLNEPDNFNKKKASNKILHIQSLNHNFENGINGQSIYLRNKSDELIIYNKTLEVKNNSRKFYIFSALKKSGLDIDNIFRMELRLNYVSLKKRSLNKSKFIDFSDDVFKKKVYKRYVNDMIDFRIVGKNKYKKHMKKVNFISI